VFASLLRGPAPRARSQLVAQSLDGARADRGVEAYVMRRSERVEHDRRRRAHRHGAALTAT
jgi:hypothetical protein